MFNELNENLFPTLPTRSSILNVKINNLLPLLIDSTPDSPNMYCPFQANDNIGIHHQKFNFGRHLHITDYTHAQDHFLQLLIAPTTIRSTQTQYHEFQPPYKAPTLNDRIKTFKSLIYSSGKQHCQQNAFFPRMAVHFVSNLQFIIKENAFKYRIDALLCIFGFLFSFCGEVTRRVAVHSRRGFAITITTIPKKSSQPQHTIQSTIETAQSLAPPFRSLISSHFPDYIPVPSCL